MNIEEIKNLAIKEYTSHKSNCTDHYIDGFIHAFKWIEENNKFKENDRNLDLVDAIKDFCGLSDEEVYPVVSFMCMKGYIKDWECIDDSFYINGKKISA